LVTLANFISLTMELKKTWGIFMFHYSVHTHKLLFIMLFIGRVFLQFDIYSF